MGTRNSSALSAGESRLIFQRAGSLMGFLELQREARVCSRVTAEEVIKNFCLFSNLRTPIYLRWTPQESKRGGRTIRTLLEVRQETKAHFLVGTVILGFLTIFKKSQASLPFEALNSECLSTCQRAVIPPVQMRWRTTAFYKVSTGNSDNPSYCEMKVEPDF